MKKKASILIVEDDASIRETMSKILQQNGYRTDTAENGYEAIQKAEARFYNLALLDIKLPDMDGMCPAEGFCSYRGERSE